MSYLSKSERRNLILQVAKSIALEEGLSTLTVRNIAKKACLSVGLIHHHYASIHELKSEVFIQLAYENLDTSTLSEDICWESRLLDILGFSENNNELAYIRLWNEAEQISCSNPEFSKVYWAAIEAWKNKIIEVLKLKKFINPNENMEDLAWQFIGITLGFERLIQFKGEKLCLKYLNFLVLQLIECKISHDK